MLVRRVAAGVLLEHTTVLRAVEGGNAHAWASRRPPNAVMVLDIHVIEGRPVCRTGGDDDVFGRTRPLLGLESDQVCIN